MKHSRYLKRNPSPLNAASRTASPRGPKRAGPAQPRLCGYEGWGCSEAAGFSAPVLRGGDATGLDGG